MEIKIKKVEEVTAGVGDVLVLDDGRFRMILAKPSEDKFYTVDPVDGIMCQSFDEIEELMGYYRHETVRIIRSRNLRLEEI